MKSIVKTTGGSLCKSTIVIRGKYIKYIPGLSCDDYAVVLPESIVCGVSMVTGFALDSQGGRSTWAMPIEVFAALEHLEIQAETPIRNMVA